MATAKAIKIRLFIEFVEVPCISATVQAQPNAPMMASIQIPPMPEGTDLMPRSLVHLFFYDPQEEMYQDNLKKEGESVPQQKGKTIGQLLEDPTGEYGVMYAQEEDMRSYKLLFAGELFGFTWSKSRVNRSLVLQCADFSNYWDYAFQFNNTNLFGPGYKAMFSGGSTNLFTDFLSSPGEIATRILMTPSKRYPELKGLLGGIVHLMEAMGGSYHTATKVRGQNIFFSIAELRLRLMQMVLAYEKDPTSQKLLGGGYGGLFGRGIGNLGDQASYRKIISMLAGVIFHEVYPQPCPYFRPGSNDSSTSGLIQVELHSLGGFSSLVPKVKSISDGVSTHIEAYRGLDSFEGDKKALNERKKELNKGLAKLRQLCTSVSLEYTKEANAKYKKEPSVGQVSKKAASLLRNARTLIGEAASLLHRNTKDTSLREKGIAKLENALEPLSQVLSLTTDYVGDQKLYPPILGQQIIKPDVWFSAPPRCNVIFPDQYMQLDYGRSFMQEPTRLLLKTNDEFFGEDELFDQFYFAPKAITLKSESNRLMALLRGDILDHEVFTGILPVFEKMGEFNIFAARSGKVDGKTPKLGLAQRSCNFLFFKHRFANRQLNITGRFNPYVAVGFPGLVIDQYVSPDAINNYNEIIKILPKEYEGTELKISRMLGTHFLANFTTVSHQVQATGAGTTSILGGYARQPEEDLEFLGVNQADVKGPEKEPAKTNLVRIAAVFPPRIGSLGPNGGVILGVEEVTYEYPANGHTPLPVYPLLDKNPFGTYTAPINTRVNSSSLEEPLRKSLGGDNLIVVFRAFELTETEKKAKDKRIDLPPEEYIRPGWYGDCWSSGNISEVYREFFGTGAITEPLQLQKYAKASQGKSIDDASASIDDLESAVLTQGAPIEEAVAFVSLAYNIVRANELDVDSFIHSYCTRPIANMLDIFGSFDLRFDADGEKVIEGLEGFHSRAAGPYEDLFGIVSPSIEEVVGIKRGSPQAVKVDKRKTKQDRVLAYTARLRVSRALLG